MEVSDPMGRTRKVNIHDAQKTMLSDLIISPIPGEQVFRQKGKYINDPRIRKKVAIINAFLNKEFDQVRIRQKREQCLHNPEICT